MRSSARRSDDSDVIRARLRALLAEEPQRAGWVPGEEDDVRARHAPWAAEQDDVRPRPVRWADEQDAPHGGGVRAARWPGREDGVSARSPRTARSAEEQDDTSARSPRAVRWADEDDTDELYDVADLPRDDAALPAGLGRHRAPGRTARLDPGRPGAWTLWVVAVLAAVVVVGWTWADRPAVEQVPTSTSSSVPAGDTTAAAEPTEDAAAPVETGTVVVSVVGQVAAPGLVTLPAGARVADALAAAGGLLPTADPASVNAAAVVTDGEQIAIGVPGVAAPAAAGSAAPGGPLDLNSATVTDLDALPGIGPVLAQRIVDHRTAQGPFTSVEQLDDVSGIGPAIYAELAERVRV
ncbi:ComEA family DNA-binding protein [uncultured Modestobacter sp.]|uniref:ComEA family DNA-binding protein n=1 Tax=uncultured Modestobacter sp. TaxID=380048 RepID=UPI00262C5682|nr:ComEA family DNA-binding protein [uncultured Modestobacter sp.]